MIGIFIDNTRDKLAEQIMSYEKKLETRNRDTLKRWAGSQVYLLTRRGEQTYIIGTVWIGRAVKDNTEQFRKLEQFHKVRPGSKYDITRSKKGVKFLYPIVPIHSYGWSRPIDTAELKHYGRQAVEIPA